MEFNLDCKNLNLGAIIEVSQVIIIINFKSVNLLRMLFKWIHHSFKIYSVIHIIKNVSLNIKYVLLFRLKWIYSFSNYSIKELQRIKKSIESGEFREESGKVILTNSDVGQIIEDIASLSYIESSHSFKVSYGLKEFLSYIEGKSIILDVLLVQVKAIVSILSKNDSIEGMEEIMNQILKYDNNLNNNIAKIIELFDQISQTNIYSLSKIDSALMRTIEDAQDIIYLWKLSPMSPLFNAVWDRLVQSWIFIDIFATQYSYKVKGQPEILTSQIFTRLFKFVTEEKLNIYHDKCIKCWDAIQNNRVDICEDEEGESEKETDCSKIDRK